MPYVDETMKRLLIDAKENCHGEIVARINYPKDAGAFVLEAFLTALGHFADSRGVTIKELLQDLYSYQNYLKRKNSK